MTAISLITGGAGGMGVATAKIVGRDHAVVLCDVSGSVASFAGFTLMLVFALREQFDRVRAFTFVDDVHEDARLGGIFNMGGAAVANYVSVLERVK